MRLLIVGAGAVGSLFAPLALLPGWQVSYYEQDKAKVKRLQKNGIRILRAEKLTAYAVQVADHLPEQPADVILLAVKTWANAGLYPALRPVVSPETALVPVQNGWGNCEALAACYDPAQVIAAVAYFGASQRADDVVVFGGQGELQLCPWQRPCRVQGQLQELLAGCRQQGILAVQKADPKAMIWQKLLVNSVINPLTAYYEIKNGALTAAPYRQQAEALLAESVQIANANGAAFTLAEAQDMLWQTVQATAANTSSMCADWLAGRPWELAAINGALLTLAEASHLSVPKQRQLVQALLQKQQERLGR